MKKTKNILALSGIDPRFKNTLLFYWSAWILRNVPYGVIPLLVMFWRIMYPPHHDPYSFSWPTIYWFLELAFYFFGAVVISKFQLYLIDRWLANRTYKEYNRYINRANRHLQVMKNKNNLTTK